MVGCLQRNGVGLEGKAERDNGKELGDPGSTIFVFRFSVNIICLMEMLIYKMS